MTRRALSGLALIALSIALGFAVRWLVIFDHRVFGALAMTEAHTSGAAIGLAQGATMIGNLGTRIVILIVGLAVFLLARLRREAIIFFLGTLAAAAATSVAKDAFGRVRPDIVPHLSDFANPSFPSGHASNTMAMLLLMALLTRRRGAVPVALGIAFVVGWTRIALGVHWPTDVIGGWLLGAGFALASSSFADPARMKRGGLES